MVEIHPVLNRRRFVCQRADVCNVFWLTESTNRLEIRETVVLFGWLQRVFDRLNPEVHYMRLQFAFVDFFFFQNCFKAVCKLL